MLTKKERLIKLKGETDITTKKTPENYLKEPYARILIPEEEGGFSAELLEFPGCFAQGDTPNEAFENLERVAKSWIETELHQGREIPPPSANQGYGGKIALRLPRSLHRLAMRKAERDGISLNQCLVTAIAAWLGADDLYSRFVEKLNIPFVYFNAQANIQLNYGIQPEQLKAIGMGLRAATNVLASPVPLTTQKPTPVEAQHGGD